MNSIQVFVNILILFLSLNAIFCDLFDNEVKIDENFDRTWGSINEDSVRVGIRIGYSKNESIGTIADWNKTFMTPRIMDGIRVTSVNNTGADAEILDGGIGYTFATFRFVGHSNYALFFVDAYENYTSSLLTTTTTTPIPDIIFREWGTIDYASKIMFPVQLFDTTSNPGQQWEDIFRINSTRPMDGIRLTSFEDTVDSAEIIEGGIGYTFARVKVIGKAENISCSFEKFENGTYTTILPTTTTILPTTTTILPTTTTVLPTTNLPTTTKKPEDEVKEWGKIDEDTKLTEKRFQGYPQSGVMANKNETIEVTGTILGMRLKSLNNTNGLWDLIGGGLNESFATFNFKGATAGSAYDFNIEIYGNSGVPVKLSIILVVLSSILLALFK